jgi:hypothetical protein
MNGVHIHRVGLAPVERLRAQLAERRMAPSPLADDTSPSLVARAVSFVNRRLWRNLYWPDTTCLWYLLARRKVDTLIERLSPGMLVSVSPTFTAVAVGYGALARARSRPCWVIDLGDPFCFLEEAPPNNFQLYRHLNYRFERACFRVATAVAVTNPATQERYASVFPESMNKLMVIPPLVSIPELPPPTPDAGARVQFVFVGTLYRNIRRPDFLLALFAALSAAVPALDLHFFGDVSECMESFARHAALIGNSIHLHGAVPRERALQAMADAAVLVNLGNETTYQLPSKVVEYAMTRKPILNIAAHEDDSSARFLASYPRQLTLVAKSANPTPNDVERTRTFLSEQHPIDAGELERWLVPFRLPAISAQYLALMEQHP